MIYESLIEVLSKVRDATRLGLIHWQKENAELYSAKVGEQELFMWFLYVEPTNRVGADKLFIDFSMPGTTAFLASGSEAYCLAIEILGSSVDSWREHIASIQSGHAFSLSFLENTTRDQHRGER